MTHSNSNLREEGDVSGFLTEEVEALTAYWQSLISKPGDVPARTKFDPIAVPSLLSTLLIVERIRDDAYKIRLQGTGFENRGIEDWTGQIWIDDPLDPENGLSFELFREVLDTPCGLCITGVEQSMSRRLTRIEAVGLPLADDEGVPRFIVVAVAPMETVGYETEEASLRTIQSVDSRRAVPVAPNAATLQNKG